jgi:hypothetical protein
MERRTKDWVFPLQVLSVGFIWVFVLSISVWIINLLRVSRELQDTPSASLAISILAIPIFLTGASVLTYVFVGLQRTTDGTDPPSGPDDSEEVRP